MLPKLSEVTTTITKPKDYEGTFDSEIWKGHFKYRLVDETRFKGGKLVAVYLVVGYDPYARRLQEAQKVASDLRKAQIWEVSDNTTPAVCTLMEKAVLVHDSIPDDESYKPARDQLAELLEELLHIRSHSN